MLSSLNASTVAPMTDVAVAVLDAPALLDAVAQATAAEANAPAFQEVLAQGAAQGQSDLLFADVPGVVDSPVTPRVDELEIDAEQWLSNALDQQSVQLQVRDLQAAQASADVPVVSNPHEQALLLRQLAATSAGAAEVIQRATKAATSSAIHTSHVVSATGAGLPSGQTSVAQTPFSGEQSGQALWGNRPASDAEAAPVLSQNNPAPIHLAQSNPVQNNPVQNSPAHNSSVPSSPAPSSSSPNSAELLFAEAAALTGVTADSHALSGERAAGSAPSSMHSTLFGLGDKAVQDTGFQAALKLPTPEAKWGEQLLHTLRDQVQVQVQQRIQNATIRLDPPELGSLEIFLSHESGRLNVHITASQADVGRLLQQTSDRLRQELAGGQFTQVNVQTSSDGQSGQQQSRHNPLRFAAEEMIQVNGQPATDKTRGQSGQASDVLMTV